MIGKNAMHSVFHSTAPRQSFRVLLWLLLAVLGYFLLMWAAARADYLNTNGSESAPNFAEIRVLDDRVRISMEIHTRDYPKFFDTNSTGYLPSSTVSAEANNSQRTFNVLVADGKKLVPQVTIIKIRPRVKRPEPARPAGLPPPPNLGPLSSEVIFLEIDYPFVGQPQELTIVPPLDEDDNVVAVIGFLSWHGDIAINDYRFLSASETLKLDWKDPWYTAYSNKNLRRHNYAPVSSFLTMEARETRLEVIFRLRDLETWIDLDLGERTKLDAKTIERVKARAGELLAENNPVTIDGIKMAPNKIRVELLSLGVTGWSIVDATAEANRETAMFGAILSYPLEELPDHVALKWQLFSERGSMIPVLETDPVGSVLDAVTIDSPLVEWTNSLKKWVNPKISEVKETVQAKVAVPVLSILLVLLGVVLSVKAVRSETGRRLAWVAPSLVLYALAYPATSVSYAISLPVSVALDRITAEKVVSLLVSNIGVSQLEILPDRFDASLVTYVARGDIEEVGLEIRRGLAVMLPSGALAQTDEIKEVRIEEVSQAGDGSRILASWTAVVTGGHWGHVHRRVIEYRALMDVVSEDGNWMLSGLTVLEARRPSANPAK